MRLQILFTLRRTEEKKLKYRKKTQVVGKLLNVNDRKKMTQDTEDSIDLV